MSTLLRLLEPSSGSIATGTAAGPSTVEALPATAALTSKPLVIVADEFDLFAQHPRQSFLYCLLDIVQGNRRRGGVAVIGVSARVVRPPERCSPALAAMLCIDVSCNVQDCLSLLEKRVRSRCQSNVLQMIPPSSFISFCDLGKRLLRVSAAATAEEAENGWATAWNAEVEVSHSVLR